MIRRGCFLLAGLLTVGLLSGCEYDYAMKKTQELSGQAFLTPHFHVERRDSVVLSDDSHVYAAFSESEAWVQADVPLASELCRAVSHSFVHAECSVDIETLEQARATAIQRGANYLFFPRVQHWRDRVDSGQETRAQFRDDSKDRSWGLDDMTIEIVILDAISGRRVDMLTVTGRAGVLQWHRHTPADMMGDALAEVFALLVQQPVR